MTGKDRTQKRMTRSGVVAASVTLGTTLAGGAVGIESAAAGSGGYDYLPASPAELSYCAWPSRWNVCNVSRFTSDEAVDLNKDTWNPPLDYDGYIGNAAQHAAWNSYMYWHFGYNWSQAKTFSDLHEQGQPNDANKTMDLHNNWVGGQMVPYLIQQATNYQPTLPHDEYYNHADYKNVQWNVDNVDLAPWTNPAVHWKRYYA